MDAAMRNKLIGFNHKFEIQVSHRRLNSWLEYIRESGHKIEVKESATPCKTLIYMADIAGFYDKATPIAVSTHTAKWHHWIYIRLPMKV